MQLEETPPVRSARISETEPERDHKSVWLLTREEKKAFGLILLYRSDVKKPNQKHFCAYINIDRRVWNVIRDSFETNLLIHVAEKHITYEGIGGGQLYIGRDIRDMLDIEVKDFWIGWDYASWITQPSVADIRHTIHQVYEELEQRAQDKFDSLLL